MLKSKKFNNLLGIIIINIILLALLMGKKKIKHFFEIKN
jgi:hypothetical protein